MAKRESNMSSPTSMEVFIIPVTRDSEKYKEIVKTAEPGGRKALIKQSRRQGQKKPPAA